MSDKSKFEQMLEKLVADDRTAAEEIFHDIVVEKSRSIYEGLLENDIKDIEVEETSKEDESKKDDDAVDEASKDESKEDDAVDEASKDESKEDEAVEEASKDEETTDESLLDIENTEIAPAEAHGGDATDDMVADIGMPAGDEDNGDDSEKGEEEIEDRVVDLEDAIDDLKAEFEKMMGDEDKSDDAEGDDAEDNGEEKEDEAFVDQSAEGETAIAVAPELGEQPAVETAVPKTASEEIREYVNKVGVTHTDGSDNSKSPVAGKNDMGGTASNIAKGGEEKGGKAPAPKEDNAGNINVPGAKVKPVAAPKAKTSTEDDTSAKSIIGS